MLSYLDGLPAEVKRTGAFTAYEQRVGELSRELILNDMLVFTRQLPRSFSSELTANGVAEYPRIHVCLSRLAQRYKKAAEQSLRATRAIHWGVVLASAGSLLSAASAATSLVVPFSGVAASLAFVYKFWLAGRARRLERTADYLSNLREEIAHSFGPSGEVLRPSEYYPASTRRIEQLLDEIKAHLAHERVGA